MKVNQRNWDINRVTDFEWKKVGEESLLFQGEKVGESARIREIAMNCQRNEFAGPWKSISRLFTPSSRDHIYNSLLLMPHSHLYQ